MSIVLSLLASPIARIVLVALAAFTFGYFKGEGSAKHRAEIATLETKITVLKTDIETAKQSAALAETQAKASDLLAAENQRRVDELANAKSCPLSRDDARRLRGIR